MTDELPSVGQADGQEATLWALASATTESEAVPSNVPVVFRQQPRAVEARHRVAYRTALLVLILSRFNQGAAKLTSLHTVMWATRTASTRRMFAAWWRGRRFANTLTERLDPDLQITLNLALVDGLVTPAANGRRIKLTGKGAELARVIDAQSELLRVEKKFLGDLRPLNDAAMERNLGGRPA